MSSQFKSWHCSNVSCFVYRFSEDIENYFVKPLVTSPRSWSYNERWTLIHFHTLMKHTIKWDFIFMGSRAILTCSKQMCVDENAQVCERHPCSIGASCHFGNSKSFHVQYLCVLESVLLAITQLLQPLYALIFCNLQGLDCTGQASDFSFKSFWRLDNLGLQIFILCFKSCQVHFQFSLPKRTGLHKNSPHANNIVKHGNEESTVPLGITHLFWTQFCIWGLQLLNMFYLSCLKARRMSQYFRTDE